MSIEPNVAALRPVVAALTALGVEHYVGGSIASSTLGVARSTNDIDVIADLALSHVPELVRRLTPTHYIDAHAVREAVRRRDLFNAIHFDTSYKVDVYLLKGDAFGAVEMGRAALLPLGPDTDECFRVGSAEGTVLHKLAWFRDGGGVSERQWTDVVGVLRVQEGALDEAYLDRWAAELGVADLLARARRAARID